MCIYNDEFCTSKVKNKQNSSSIQELTESFCYSNPSSHHQVIHPPNFPYGWWQKHVQTRASSTSKVRSLNALGVSRSPDTFLGSKANHWLRTERLMRKQLQHTKSLSQIRFPDEKHISIYYIIKYISRNQASGHFRASSAINFGRFLKVLHLSAPMGRTKTAQIV